MEHENLNLKKIQENFSSQLENQKKIWEEEQIKAKELFNQLRQDSIDNFEETRNNIERHIAEVNNFGKNIQSHFQNQPFDFQSLSTMFSQYHNKQLELISQATHKQTQKLSDLQNKLVDFYQEKQTIVKNEMDNTIEKTIENTIEKTVEAMATTKEVVEKIIKKTQGQNKSTSEDKKPVKSPSATSVRNSKPSNNLIKKNSKKSD